MNYQYLPVLDDDDAIVVGDLMALVESINDEEVRYEIPALGIIVSGVGGYD